MRPLAGTAFWLLLAAGPALAGAPADAGAPLPRIVVAFTNEPLAAPGPAGTTGSRYAGTGYGVGQSAQRQAHSVAAAYSLREVTSWPIQVLSMNCVVFEVANGRPVTDVVAALSKDSRVALAQPLQEFHTLTTEGATAPPSTAAASSAAVAPSAAAAPSAAGAPYNDPLYDLQTNMSALGIARAHARTQGAGVRVALIDTGVDVDHPDLRGAIVHSHSFIGRPVSSGALRHGTAMAGLIAAVANNHIGIVGIAPRAQIEVFEACWQLAPGSDAASCNTFTLARALAATLASGAPLVNLSFAGPADPLLTALVQTGLKRGVTFIGAAAPADAPFPTAIPGVITAAGTEQPLPAGALAAPSQHVLTLRPGGEYDFESGTSVAAAEITAVLALLVSASPTRLPTATLVSLIEGPTAAAVTSAVPPVDVNAALSRLDATHGGRTIAARAPRP
ncbi:MAG TPA: S8 family serine peptidase [Steroidobacteraceae bacterium]